MKNDTLPPGPWQDEPDSLTWEFCGLVCNVSRSSSLGHLCGYVNVPETHKAFGSINEETLSRLDVHGGVTWNRAYHPKLKTTGSIWVGFDCAHDGDVCPMYTSLYLGTYKNLEYVIKEINKLAKQLIDLG